MLSFRAQRGICFSSFLSGFSVPSAISVQNLLLSDLCVSPRSQRLFVILSRFCPSLPHYFLTSLPHQFHKHLIRNAQSLRRKPHHTAISLHQTSRRQRIKSRPQRHAIL